MRPRRPAFRRIRRSHSRVKLPKFQGRKCRRGFTVPTWLVAGAAGFFLHKAVS
jgi:hypothetical protein